MDGVISDTQKVHAQEISKALADVGINITPAQFSQEFAGVPLKETVAILSKRFGVSVPDDVIAVARESVIAKLKKGVDAMPDAIDVVNRLSENYVLALESTNRLETIKVVLESLHLQNAFSTIVSMREVASPKPSPDVFLLAAQRLGVDPAQCVVVEDSLNGMKAGVDAGMYVIGYDNHHRVNLPAHQVVTELSAIPFIIESLKRKN